MATTKKTLPAAQLPSSVGGTPPVATPGTTVAIAPVQQNIQSGSVTIPAVAGGQNGVITSQLNNAYFLCTSASAPFLLQFDNDNPFLAQTGTQIQGNWRRITFYNTTGTAIVVNFQVSNKPIPYVAANAVKDASSRAVGGGVTALGAGNSVQVIGLNAGNQRKQIVVHNLDANLQLNVLDANGTIFDVLMPLQDWTLATDATISVKNPNGQAVNVAIGEIYYNA